MNIILNFSFLISAASFTLNLLPRAKKQHGIHETCTHHRKCDYSLSISLSTLVSHHPRQHGNRETCSHLRLDYFSFSLSRLLFLPPHPPCSSLPFNPFYFIFPSHLSRFVLSILLSLLQCLFFLRLYFTPLCSEVILSLISRALFVIIVVIFLLFFLRAHTYGIHRNCRARIWFAYQRRHPRTV